MGGGLIDGYKEGGWQKTSTKKRGGRFSGIEVSLKESWELGGRGEQELEPLARDREFHNEGMGNITEVNTKGGSEKAHKFAKA